MITSKTLLFELLLPLLTAAITVLAIHPKLVAMARDRFVVDRPDNRKLQSEPVPVLGGVGVFMGIVLSSCVFSYLIHTDASLIVFVAMLLMLYTGVYDDIMGLTPSRKLLMQLVAVTILIAGNFKLDNMHGLWGSYGLSDPFALPLTVVACIGVINSLNLIDGVDGLVAGCGILESVLAGIWFLTTENHSYAIMAFATTGALVPFFYYNVFGRKNKMYFGDGGSLVLGLLASVWIIQIDRSPATIDQCEGRVAMLLAIFAMPVFDTLRVMTQRLIKGRSPFAADRRHLHHALVDAGLTHLQTVATIIGLNVVVVAIWWVTDLFGTEVDTQFYITVAAAVAATGGTYALCQHIVTKREKAKKKQQTTDQI